MCHCTSNIQRHLPIHRKKPQVTANFWGDAIVIFFTSKCPIFTSTKTLCGALYSKARQTKDWSPRGMPLHQQHPGTLADTEKTAGCYDFLGRCNCNLYIGQFLQCKLHTTAVLFIPVKYTTAVSLTPLIITILVLLTPVKNYFTGRIISPVTHSLNLYYKFKKGKKNLSWKTWAGVPPTIFCSFSKPQVHWA